MRVKGKVRGRLFHILVDSGSTHNFLDFELAKKIGCVIESVSPQTISVANGNHIVCKHVCKGFEWEMQDRLFTTDTMLIDLGGCDMVLGVQWLATLGPICWDFKELLMQFDLQGQQFVLQGVHPQKVKMLNGAPSVKMLTNVVELCLLQVRDVAFMEIQAAVQPETPPCPPEIETLKLQYQDLFTDPDTLPPHRGVFDHTIPLEPGARPVNIRPYKYPL